MRLLFVTQDFPPDVGGIQTYSWEVATRLAKWVEALEVIAPHRPSAAEIDQAAPVSIIRVPGRPDWLPATSLPTVVRRSARLRPDVAVHAQWQTVGASVLARQLTGFPRRIACAAHGRELLFNPLSSLPGLGAAYDRLRRWALAQPDVLLPVSRYTARLLRDRGVPPNRLHVVPNGTNPTRFRPHGGTAVRDRLGVGERPMLLTVGRLVPRKGVDTVLRALPRLAASVPTVQYVVAGTGPDRDRLERLALRQGVRDWVHFVGHVADETLPLYYSAADLFVMPAREAPPNVEGFGLVFLEANACGTAVVGARSGGVPDAIVNGETGLLVPPSDPRALAGALTDLLQDPARRNRLSRQGRTRTVRTANWNRVAQSIYALLSNEA
ncbi:glycosyltransferase family 4 protein [Salinibacter altiplanensis]|uniref:glycosyltransferase family 4 protein n=1 Tax=Salinibacter altiplanensis TaxID=1803181 RepID=UPI000C9F0EEA|nr:glycosyltransferase family 4 protein [Salinibacter altiplanensis]